MHLSLCQLFLPRLREVNANEPQVPVPEHKRHPLNTDAIDDEYSNPAIIGQTRRPVALRPKVSFGVPVFTYVFVKVL